MATIGNDPNGRKRILFVAGDGSRKPIRLGKATTKQAEAFKLKVESLITAGITGSMDDETARWLASLDDKMHGRVAAVGLVKSRTEARGGTALAAFIDAYIADRTDAKPRTIINLKQARTDLVAFFGEQKPLCDVTPGDAEEFGRYLQRRGLATNTARRIIGRAKQFFRFASRKGKVTVNPFADMKTKVQASDAERDFFITQDMAASVLDACPDAEWRLIFALSRYGGLRCPSEHFALRWDGIDWDKGRMKVYSPKTEHIEGGAWRMVPIFPELRPYLMEAFEQAADGAVHVIMGFRDTSKNLRTRMHSIIRRAGLEPWPKTFHNLRSTRQTELSATYPGHVVCAWIGNTESVARKHYLRVTEADFEKAAQNQAQYPAEVTRTGRHVPAPIMQNRPVLPGDSASYVPVPHGGYPQGESNHRQN